MLSALSSLLDSLSAMWSFLIHQINSIVYMVGQIPRYTAFLYSALNVLPEIVLPFCLASISLGALLFFLGR